MDLGVTREMGNFNCIWIRMFNYIYLGLRIILFQVNSESNSLYEENLHKKESMVGNYSWVVKFVSINNTMELKSFSKSPSNVEDTLFSCQ